MIAGRDTALGKIIRYPWRRPELQAVRFRYDRIRHMRALRRRGLVIAADVDLGVTLETVFTFGQTCSIGRGSLLALEKGRLELGDRVLLGSYANLRAVDSFIRIGSRVQVAQFVSIIATNHRVGDNGVPLWNEHDLRPGKHGVVIGDDCWLGAGAVVLPGVELGDRCVVGAGAVVTRSMPAGSLVVGNPARPIDSTGGQHITLPA